MERIAIAMQDGGAAGARHEAAARAARPTWWAEVHTGRLPALAAELVSRQVAVIVASSTPAVLAAKAATGEIPIVFGIAIDPLSLGLWPALTGPAAT
jgi:hypothetical protein